MLFRSCRPPDGELEGGAAVRPEESTTEQKIAKLLESLSECGNNCGNLEITAFPCSEKIGRASCRERV